MDFARFPSPIPQISISPASPELPRSEPDSPYSFFNSMRIDDEFRPALLTPPPNLSSFQRECSPMNPQRELNAGQGLDNLRFQALLDASKERFPLANPGIKKDLRREIALKVHRNKQAERRALFLSKVQAPPSPTAAVTPKTPPDSPAIFHYTLPSPGLVSPLALFESWNEDSNSIHHSWVEQVDFKLSGQHEKQPTHENVNNVKTSLGLPSLDQISARMIQRSAKPDDLEIPNLAVPDRRPARPSVGIGRLRMPVRIVNIASVPDSVLPPDPLLRLSPRLRVTTLVVPRSLSNSQSELTESNLNALNARGQKADNMLSTLRRRTVASECKLLTTEENTHVLQKWKRRSAPADFTPLRPRLGFEHPALALPGGF